MNYRYPSVGALLHDDITTFTVWAPLHKNVTLYLNDLQTPMAMDERGYWSVIKKNVRQGDRYCFALDDEKNIRILHRDGNLMVCTRVLLLPGVHLDGRTMNGTASHWRKW